MLDCLDFKPDAGFAINRSIGCATRPLVLIFIGTVGLVAGLTVNGCAATKGCWFELSQVELQFS